MKNNIQQTTYNRQITANPYSTVNRKPSTVNRIYHSSFVIHNCPQASPIPHKNKNGKPIIQWTSPKGPKDIFDEVESVFGKEAALGRSVKMFLCQRYTGEKLKDIGACFGVGESGVSQACRRVKDKIRKDKKLEGKISKIEKKIKV